MTNEDHRTSQAQPGAAAPAAPPARGKRSGEVLRTWVRDLLISLALSGFVILFLYQPVKVEGNSMLPGLQDQERIFINKFVYQLEPIERGDIVVFRYPRDPSKSYIKRVVGVAGDRIRIERGRVYVNGQALPEPYVPSSYVDGHNFPELVVPAHSYYVLGDHRTMSNDSREFGPVDESYIYGKAVFVYWPMDKMGMLK
ncbi:MAG TPA: signal peptidase I [Terriglobales bacterium]|nr:signal peptidase I [Terriglobales bacterium]